MSKIAIIQHAPHVLDRQATIDKAVRLIQEAAGGGAELIVFPEAFVPGYPAWIWRLKPGGNWGLSEQIHQRLLGNAVDLASDDLAMIRQATADAGVTVVMSINERDGSVGRTTLYNSVVVIGADGEVLNHHRKLMPTNPERMVWGFGDGAGLQAVDTPVGASGCCCAGRTLRRAATKPHSEPVRRFGTRRVPQGMAQPLPRGATQYRNAGQAPFGRILGGHPLRCGDLTGERPAGVTAPCGLTVQRSAECDFVAARLSTCLWLVSPCTPRA